ncbi:histidine kinase [Streptomyces sp. NPDC086554]|uniref:sensor histidine kinase n=1 Tax=Streptomyces sp. NPDC086554 TaxID=3154864 RepID=UPI003415EB03
MKDDWLSERHKRLLFLLLPVALSIGDTIVWIGSMHASALGVAIGLVGAFALLARRRAPVAVLLATVPGTYLGTGWFAGLAALYTVARLRSERSLLIACALLAAVAQYLPYPLGLLAEEGWENRSAESALMVLAPVALGRAVALQAELATGLRELTESRAREHQLVARQVLATERARLGREMHDVVAHQVSLISLQAGALRMSSTEPAVREAADAIRRLSVSTLEELRHMVGLLRAAGVGGGELSPQPRLADLDRLIGECGSDIDADIDAAACSDCPDAVERAAFRIVQEALTNVRKHAPGAKVWVSLRRQGEQLRVEVRNGPASAGAEPLDLPSGGHGLIGLHERVHLLGGSFEATALADGGFLVSAILPTGAP